MLADAALVSLQLQDATAEIELLTALLPDDLSAALLRGDRNADAWNEQAAAHLLARWQHERERASSSERKFATTRSVTV